MARRGVLDSERKGTTFPRHFHPRDIPSSFAPIRIFLTARFFFYQTVAMHHELSLDNRSITQIDNAFTISAEIKIFFKNEFSILSAEKCPKILEIEEFSVKTKETQTKTDPIKETQEHTRLVGNLASSLKSKRRCIHNYRAFVASVQLRTTLL